VICIISYGTLVYLPEDSLVDFGQSAWPSPFNKQIVCPRAVLVSTWTDGKFGMPGGGLKKGESELDGLNREFNEEIGFDVHFTDSDFCFSFMDKKLVFVFCKVTRDRDLFERVLKSFTDGSRESYVNEIIGVVGYPIWVEGPEQVEDVSWSNNVWGFPRHLCAQGGMYVWILLLAILLFIIISFHALAAQVYTYSRKYTHTTRTFYHDSVVEECSAFCSNEKGFLSGCVIRKSVPTGRLRLIFSTNRLI
jgi:8-oxo-dGTP pyrophosphatase MutT (NUDIX family)